MKTIHYSTDTIHFYPNSISENSFKITLNNNILSSTNYSLNPIFSSLIFTSNFPDSTVFKIEFEESPLNLNQDFSHKNDSIIFTSSDTIGFENYIYQSNSENNSLDFFESSSLKKQGSLSRGISIGNAQNLSLQSTLNLQLSGKIGPNLYIKGSISDDNIPFQPDGNTQKLQEFDQVYLQIYNDNFNITGGDFWAKKPDGYFLNYNKRVQGLSVSQNNIYGAKSNININQKLSGALSKGKFSRLIIQGVEGNQGPYRLYGANNEQNIIILAGTEKIYIDGILMKRGQEYDYTIDYNTSEITFTANQLITKDKRLIAEFQYSDLSYARSIINYNLNIKSEKYAIWANIYNEQDAKNQPIQENLNFDQIQILSNIGDSTDLAFANSIYQTAFDENRIMYYIKDSLNFDSILIHTLNIDSGMYQATFNYVGEANGNYIIESYTANGKIFKWIAPVNNIPQGNYDPVQLITTPQKKQLINIGGKYSFSKNLFSEIEFARSNTDLNTFSKIDNDNNIGYGIKWNINHLKKFKKKKTLLKSSFDFEYNDPNFTYIQWYRSAEFDRDWNTRGKKYTGNQIISKANIGFEKTELYKLNYQINQFTWGEDYSGWKNDLSLNYKKNGLNLNSNINYLKSESEQNSSFYRHRININKKWNKFKIGYTDQFENNQFSQDNSLTLNSYQFYDYKIYIATADSIKNHFELYFQKRYDKKSDSLTLKKAAEATTIGANINLIRKKNNQLSLNLNYRQLIIKDSLLINNQPENTILGRVEHQFSAFKRGITSQIFYELNSGLELKKEFIYIKVNNGQGIYTWNDYNDDGIKDLGEFEIAQFTDQAEYIKLFIASNEYVRTYGNQYSHSIFIKPERMIKNKKGIKKILTRISNQTIFKINRKTNFENGINYLNPFISNINDTTLIKTNSSFRNTLYINRTNPIFGIEYHINLNATKTILTSGFDAINYGQQKIKIRWNISKIFNLKNDLIYGNKESLSEYALNRNYNYEFRSIISTFSIQPNTKYRIALKTEFSIKENNSDLNEAAQIIKVGFDTRVNQKKKGSLNFSFNYIKNAYNGIENTPLAFELLNALKVGDNYVWGVSYQKKLAKNLQMNFTYNGRKSELNKSIHSGGIEIRAFF